MHYVQQDLSALLSVFSLAVIVLDKKETDQYELKEITDPCLPMLGFSQRPTTCEVLERLSLTEQVVVGLPISYNLPEGEGRPSPVHVMACNNQQEDVLLIFLCKGEEMLPRHDLLFTLDDHYVITNIESLFLVQHLRLPVSDVLGKSFTGFFDGQTTQQWFILLERARSTHSKQSLFFHSPITGDSRFFKATASYHEGRGCFLIGVDTVFTQASAISARREAIKEGLLIVQEKGQSTTATTKFADAIAAELLEQDKDQLLGTPLDALFPYVDTEGACSVEYESPTGTKKQLRLASECFDDQRLVRIWEEYIPNMLRDQSTRAQGLWINLLLQLSYELQQTSSDAIELTMQRILQRLGEFSGSDRVYIFECLKDGSSVSNTYEWCAPGIRNMKEHLQNIACTYIPQWMESLANGQEIYIVQVENLPPSWEAERTILIQQEIKSVLIEPIMASKKLLGFIGFDSVRTTKDWPEEVRELLLFFASILGAFLSRISVEQQLAQALKTTTNLAATRERQNRSLSAFYAKMSHDIRNALYAITGSSEQLLHMPLTTKQNQTASLIYSNAVFVSHLIQDLLDFSTLSDRPLLLRNERFSLHDVFKRSCDAVSLLASEKHLVFVQSYDQGIPETLLGDGVRLSQILINLLHNAIKFTDKGSITLKAKLVNQTQEVATITFCVHDTGRGFDDKKHSQSGHGLGLMIVRQLLSAMGAKLSIESKAQAGTTICSTIAFERPAKASNKPIRKDLSILVVDDSAMSRQLLKEQLHDLGYGSVTTAERGDEAITLIASNSYQLILLDLTMPYLDGVETAKRLLSINPQLPIIALTSYLSREREQEARDVGIKHVLLKPVEKQDLSNLLEKVFQP